MDNAATSYPKPEVVYTAINDFNRNLGGNPGRGSNQQTLKAGSIMLQAREALARLFNISDSLRIAFALNITEALNTGLKGILQPGDHVITTSMEHNAVARPLNVLANQGIEWTTVQCAPDGSLDPLEVEKAIKSNTRLICMLHASNVTGTVMPIGEVGKIARDKQVLFMVDTAQTAGILSIDVMRDNIDVLTFTGHKGLMGPQGTGGIYIGPELIIRPLKEGGTGSLSEFLEQPQVMPDLLESGTPNTPGIAGLLAGIEFIAATGLETIRNHEQSLTEQLLQGLKEIKGVTVYGPGNSNRQTAVAAFNIEGRDCGDVCMRLDYEYGIVTRSGLHCAPLAHKTMGTLEMGACRLSPGFFTTSDDIDKVLKAIYNIAK
ncbi:MAG TPA: aminotransferase class V-fold PLP-dependent enzyme [Bacteroidales bacterium]|nr:aminotransferase class V-fold PLP-dependent enzyme [Bacteroidales bacterium]